MTRKIETLLGASDTDLVPLVELSVPVLIDPDDPVGLLPSGSDTKDLEVFIDSLWPNPARAPFYDEVKWYWAEYKTEPADENNLAGSRTLAGDIDPSLFPLKLVYDQRFLQTDGPFEVWYTVTSSFSGETVSSFARTLTVDSQTPGEDRQGEALVPPADLGGVITDAYLQAHGDKVEYTLPLPLYNGARDLDVVALYWFESIPGVGLPVAEVTVYQADIDANLIKVILQGDVIRAPMKNGTFYAAYKLRDRAGNESLTISREISAVVALTPWPSVLPPPRVPLHEDDALIHRADARAGVKVVIDWIVDIQPGDVIAFDWDGFALLEVPAVFPLSVLVPWSALTAKGVGPLSASVSYKLRRGSTSKVSPSTVVNIDFTVAGQDHPGAPALVNPLLDRVEVMGESGIPNELRATDKAYPVKASVQLYQSPVAGQTLNLYWGAWPEIAATYTVQPGDQAGQSVFFTDVPWHIIDADPHNLALPVYYTTSNNVNQQSSSNTLVKVQVVTIDDLSTPKFPGADKWGYINCTSLEKPWDGIRINIEFNGGYFELADEITVFWQGCNNFNGTDPIAGTEKVISLRVLHTHLVLGYAEVIVGPYEPHIKPMVEGSGLVYYTLSKTDGRFGESTPDFVKITRAVPGGDPCEPPSSTKG